MTLGMGSGWEANIARLIDQANETLSSSARSRQYSQAQFFRSADGSGVIRPASSPYRGSPVSNRFSPTSFRGDRAASYRRGSEGWDTSLLMKGPSARPGRAFVGTALIPPPVPLSHLARARVNDARIDGMEDRIKLEVQPVAWKYEKYECKRVGQLKHRELKHRV